MAEHLVVMWSAVQGRLPEHDECVARIMDYWREHADGFRLKSLRYFSQGIGGDPFGYGRVLVYEFASLADWESFEAQMGEDEVAKGLKEELFANIDLRTRTVVEWQDELRERWLEQPQS